MIFDNLELFEKAAWFERWTNTQDYLSCKLAAKEEGFAFDAAYKDFCFREWFLTFHA